MAEPVKADHRAYAIRIEDQNGNQSHMFQVICSCGYRSEPLATFRLAEVELAIHQQHRD